jgi:hypothetical protein
MSCEETPHQSYNIKVLKSYECFRNIICLNVSDAECACGPLYNYQRFAGDCGESRED